MAVRINSLTFNKMPLIFGSVRHQMPPCDMYPVEDLKRRTNVTGVADEVVFKAKEIHACRHKQLSFQSLFAPPRKFNFCSNGIKELKAKAAELFTRKFEYFLAILTWQLNNLKPTDIPNTPPLSETSNLFCKKIIINQVRSSCYH